MIKKHGTVTDKAVLLDAMAWNHPHKGNRTFVVYGNARTDGLMQRAHKTSRWQAIGWRREAVSDAFGDELVKLFLILDCLCVLVFTSYGFISTALQNWTPHQKH